MRIPPTFEQQKKPGDKGYLQYLTTVLTRMWTQLANVVNYGIQLYNVQPNGVLAPGNIKGYAVTVNLIPGSNTIAHNLGYAPRFIIPTFYGATGSIYMTAVNTTTVTVNCNATVSAALLIA